MGHLIFIITVIHILLLNIYIFISSYKGHTFALVCTEPYDLGSKVGRKEGRKKMFYLTKHSTHGYMASDIWLRTILTVRKETRCRHIGYSFRLTARVLLYAPSHRQDSTYHGLCYTSRGALAARWVCFWLGVRFGGGFTNSGRTANEVGTGTHGFNST